VLADYTPMGPRARNRKLLITKIIPQAEGSKLWAEFQDEFDRRRAAVAQQQHIMR